MGKNENKTAPRLINILKIQLILLVVLGVVFLSINYLILPIKINAKGMQPTYKIGDIGFAKKQELENISREDTVILEVKDEYWLLRVIGLPNDSIACVEGELLINNVPYILQYAQGKYTDFDEVELQDDEIYALGDNLDQAIDSRRVGVFKLSDIVAKDIQIVFKGEK